ncbi:MAG TPA: DUF3604 domain-containing protein [Myxococcota bacterium]|nr:DUF3604 domain-containing protein [Myxococcota bacterium]
MWWLMWLGAGCTPASIPGAEPVYTEERSPCAGRTATRVALYGDLHVHAGYSFDARNYGTTATPDQVLAFARGAGPIRLPPFDEAGAPTREVWIDRPLDFVSATEHGDFLGEVAHCTTPGSPGYDSSICDAYQGGDPDAAFDFGVMLAAREPKRDVGLCGPDGTGCREAARGRWATMQAEAHAAYDTSSACTFTTFVGYEYTNSRDVSNLHRNVVFRGTTVPDLPVTTFEAPEPALLWEQLDAQCNSAGTGCEAIVLPHNSNLSNGRLFYPLTEGTTAEQRRQYELRARMEPIVEIHQHKGQSECRNGFGAPDDPDCAFEQVRPPEDDVCHADELGTGGMRNWGCTHALDYARDVLLLGLQEGRRTGVNPYQLGFIGSTDTHSGLAGNVGTVGYPGHVGIVDDTPEERLGAGNITHDAFIDNPGGLAGVWAVENGRDAIWEGLQRRETFATSGPRIPVRLFAGWDLPEDLCDREDGLDLAYRRGVPMGGVLGDGRGELRLWLVADADPGTERQPGVGLGRLQLIKGWMDDAGATHEQVVVEVDGADGSLDLDTCAASGGSDHLCAVWTDPDPGRAAFWYVRALEVPTCRWSRRECNTFAPEARPSRCSGTWVQDAVEQRAWSSPVFLAR